MNTIAALQKELADVNLTIATLEQMRILRKRKLSLANMGSGDAVETKSLSSDAKSSSSAGGVASLQVQLRVFTELAEKLSTVCTDVAAARDAVQKTVEKLGLPQSKFRISLDKGAENMNTQVAEEIYECIEQEVKACQSEILSDLQKNQKSTLVRKRN